MKRIAFFVIALAISLGVNAQSYDKLWKEYDENIENYLPLSAGKILDKIEKQATKDKNDVQLLKTVVKRCKIINMVADNPEDTIPGYCKSYLPKLSKASQVILKFEIYKYDGKIDDLLQYQDDDFIKTVSMEKYVDIFPKDNLISYDLDREPTLYDYVMHNLIKDYSLYSKRDALYEKLLDFDLKNNYIKAYYNNRLEQIGSLYNSGAFEKCSQLAEECPDKELKAKIKIMQIEYLTRYDYGNTNTDKRFVKAEKLCEEVMDMLDSDHPLYAQCVEFINSLTQKTIQVSIDAVNVPNQPIAVGLTYRNTSNPTYKIISVTTDEFRKLNRCKEEDLYKNLITKEAVVEKTVKATVETDYEEHSSLIALPALQQGQYYLVFSNNKSFDNYEDLIFVPFQVSELSYFSLLTDDNLNVYVVNRETGYPMGNAEAHFKNKVYKYKTNAYEYVEIGQAVSDKNGMLVAPKGTKSSFYIDLYCGNDTLLGNYSESSNNYTYNDTPTVKTNIFTDRAIYRPGQTVYFKGIFTARNSQGSELLPDYEEVVCLYDANYEIVETLHVKSDDYGAFSGSFTIPSDRVRGTYQIKCNYEGASFKVENYKRPTFEVTFTSDDNDYFVGDSVTVTGKIAALSGFGLDNVNYTYTIIRKTSFPFRYWYLMPDNYDRYDDIIHSDQNVTSADGSFAITFQLSPETADSYKDLPLYRYEINVEATNKQGETQRGTYYINTTYNKYDIYLGDNKNSSSEMQTIDIKDLKNYNVNVTTISGKPAKTQIDCKIFKLKEQDRYPRNIGNFDRQLLSDDELMTLFPKFNYYATRDKEQELVYERVIDVDGKAPLLQKNDKLPAGQYIIELRSVDDELSVFCDQYVICDRKSKKMPYKAMYWTNIDKTSAQPGETINYYVGSSESDVTALIVVKRYKTILKAERVKLNNNVYKFSYKVREEDRGKLDFQVALEKHNTEMRRIDYVEVPYNNMDLDIVVNTERNKMLPGSEETWSVTVKNYKNKPVEASLMAVMYDASLDNFATLDWYFNTKPSLQSSSFIMSDRSFNTVEQYQYFKLASFNYPYNLVLSDVTLLPVYYGFRDYYDGYLEKAESTSAWMMADMNEEFIEEETEGETPENIQPAKIRKDFNETAFFYPNLKTDKDGNATFTFTMPDALTRWNLKLLTYNKDMCVGTYDKSVVTQQPVMIMADMPRFVYDEDTLWIAANVINMSDEDVTPKAKLEIFDENENPVDIIISQPVVYLKNIPAGRSHSARWKVAMKKDINPLIFRFSATTEGFSDAEQHLLPVLSTEIFMTQTYSLTVESHTTKDYEISTNNEGERNHSITFDIKANPLLYAIKALPYIANDDESYITNAFNRFFVNKMAQDILINNPEIKGMLDADGNDTLSELQKHEELKAILLKETPWVYEAKSEARQRANISKLFDTESLSDNISSAFNILGEKQTYNGGWAWIDGMPESEYITQYILSGLARLGIDETMTYDAFFFLENKITERYSKLDTQKKKDNAICDFTTMKELYAMSFFNYDTYEGFDEAKTFYLKKLHDDWKRYGIEEQSYIALILNRNGYNKKTALIIKSLRERAIKNELGMYWRNISVENEARILEAFNEIDPKTDEIDNMRLWILTQKRTNMWENDRASVEAIFALMNRGTDWSDDKLVESAMITNNDGTVSIYVDNNTNHVVWGGVFRQYFVPIDKVQKHNDAMKVKRELFVERVIDNEIKYLPISEENIKVGDKIKVEITFENSQAMEFVYLKDLRGACFEPLEQISRYHWDDGLWYYQSTTDVSMEYFFENLPKGKHTVTHMMYVTKEGSFSAGYSLIQCQYAPEFGAYSNGMRISVK